MGKSFGIMEIGLAGHVAHLLYQTDWTVWG